MSAIFQHFLTASAIFLRERFRRQANFAPETHEKNRGHLQKSTKCLLKKLQKIADIYKMYSEISAKKVADII